LDRVGPARAVSDVSRLRARYARASDLRTTLLDVQVAVLRDGRSAFQCGASRQRAAGAQKNRHRGSNRAGGHSEWSGEGSAPKDAWNKWNRMNQDETG